MNLHIHSKIWLNVSYAFCSLNFGWLIALLWLREGSFKKLKVFLLYPFQNQLWSIWVHSVDSCVHFSKQLNSNIAPSLNEVAWAIQNNPGTTRAIMKFNVLKLKLTVHSEFYIIIDFERVCQERNTCSKINTIKYDWNQQLPT